jgi:hypothetical protein
MSKDDVFKCTCN